MQDRCAGRERRIDPDIRVEQLARNVYGDIIDTGDMPECLKRGDDPVQSHECIQITPAQTLKKLLIFCGGVVSCVLGLFQQDQVPCPAGLKFRTFPVEQSIQRVQIEQDRFPALFFQRNFCSAGIVVIQQKSAAVRVPVCEAVRSGLSQQGHERL